MRSFKKHSEIISVWENYRAMRNPEKYDPAHNKDKESFAAKRKRRMADPERGINSPAFKEFMKSQGM